MGLLAIWRASVMKHLFKPLPKLIGLFVISLLICRTSNTFELTNIFMVMNWSFSALKLSSTVLVPQLSHEPITELKTEEPRQELGFPKIPLHYVSYPLTHCNMYTGEDERKGGGKWGPQNAVNLFILKTMNSWIVTLDKVLEDVGNSLNTSRYDYINE